MKVGIITVSDRSSSGEREDVSGKILVELAEQKLSAGEVLYRLVPDDRDAIVETMIELSDHCGCRLILTTGGTGFSSRDITPEATVQVIEREVPGIPEALRWKSMDKTPFAMLSRSRAGIRGETLIINFPGSPKGASECFEILLPVLPHAMEILGGRSTDCGRNRDHP